MGIKKPLRISLLFCLVCYYSPVNSLEKVDSDAVDKLVDCARSCKAVFKKDHKSATGSVSVYVIREDENGLGIPPYDYMTKFCKIAEKYTSCLEVQGCDMEIASLHSHYAEVSSNAVACREDFLSELPCIRKIVDQRTMPCMEQCSDDSAEKSVITECRKRNCYTNCLTPNVTAECGDHSGYLLTILLAENVLSRAGIPVPLPEGEELPHDCMELVSKAEEALRQGAPALTQFSLLVGFCLILKSLLA